MVLSSTSVADARTYYGKYNKKVVSPIMVDRMREAHGDALDNSVFVNASFGDDSNTNIYDYDGDGKKETVKVSATWKDGYVNGAKITMNGKDSGFWVDYYGDICFYAMELNGEPIGFIQYSDTAGKDGGIWTSLTVPDQTAVLPMQIIWKIFRISHGWNMPIQVC